jgi:hypothetical protein
MLNRDGMIIDHAVDAFVPIHQLRPMADGADVVTDMDFTRGLNPAEDTIHQSSIRSIRFIRLIRYNKKGHGGILPMASLPSMNRRYGRRGLRQYPFTLPLCHIQTKSFTPVSAFLLDFKN